MLPVLTAIGVILTLVGVTTGVVLSVAGAILTIGCGVQWVSHRRGTAVEPRLPDQAVVSPASVARIAENLQESVDAGQETVAGQLTTASGLDTKLMGLLAFAATAAALMLTVTHGLASSRWIVFIGAVGAIAVSLVGTVVPRDLKSGPDPIVFYADYGGVPADEFTEQLLADLGKTIRANEAGIYIRRALLSGATGWALLSAAIFGIVRALS